MLLLHRSGLRHDGVVQGATVSHDASMRYDELLERGLNIVEVFRIQKSPYQGSPSSVACVERHADGRHLPSMTDALEAAKAKCLHQVNRAIP